MTELCIFHVRELLGEERELVVRAISRADAVSLSAEKLGIDLHRAEDPREFAIAEVNYGEDFLAGGPRGVIVVF